MYRFLFLFQVIVFVLFSNSCSREYEAFEPEDLLKYDDFYLTLRSRECYDDNPLPRYRKNELCQRAYYVLVDKSRKTFFLSDLKDDFNPNCFYKKTSSNVGEFKCYDLIYGHHVMDLKLSFTSEKRGNYEYYLSGGKLYSKGKFVFNFNTP